MQKLQRRHFLQLAGGTLATLGLGQLDFHRQARQYNRALAQPTRRKLALLVGINAYPEPIPSLRGCLTDVEMQYELLVHRYGFNPKDILVVADRSLSLPGQTAIAPPTRQNILEAFETHLIDQAKPGDVVVFHYSGHGSLVQEENGLPELQGFNGTLVPADGRSQPGNQVDDIMGKTLFLLSTALPTENLTVVLDSCHSGGGIRGNAVVRALTGLNAQPSDQELAYQEKWMGRLDLDAAALLDRRRQGIAKGVALGSAQFEQLAADRPFEGFYAGAFTYLLTRYLWQLPAPQPLSEVFVNIARSTQDVANEWGILQNPIFAIAPDQPWDDSPVYLLNSPQPPAEAVLREVTGDQVSFWLGGLAVNNLSAQDIVFSLIDDQGAPIGEVIQKGRDGLLGRGVLSKAASQALAPGQMMRERIRGVPKNLALRVGVAPSLADLSAEALAELNSLSRLEGVLLTPDTSVDYVLGRFTEAAPAAAPGSAVSAPANSIGILTPDLTPVPQTFTASGESVSQAIRRLKPRFKMLLAGKMLGKLINSNVSRLNVDVAVRRANTPEALVTVGSRSAHGGREPAQVLSGAARVAVDSEIQLQVTNLENQDLFVSILTISSQGTMAILHPMAWDAPEKASRLATGGTLVVPDPNAGGDRFRFVVRGPAGFFELMVLASTGPLRETLRSLQTIARSRGTRSGNPLAFAEGVRGNNESENAPVEVVDALLRDLDEGSQGNSGTAGSAVPAGDQLINAESLAAFSLVVEVV